MKKEIVDIINKLVDSGFSAVYNGTLTTNSAATMVKGGIEKIIQSKVDAILAKEKDMGNLYLCGGCREKNREILSDKYKFF
jgi:hypothetical protein